MLYGGALFLKFFKVWGPGHLSPFPLSVGSHAMDLAKEMTEVNG